MDLPNTRATSAPTGGNGRSILVVEDEPLLRGLVANALRSRGYEVVTAANATEARQQFDAVDPDGIVMDVELGPGPSGFQLAEALLEDETGVAIVFLTNVPDPRFAGDEIELPAAVAYLNKRLVMDVDSLALALDAALRGTVADSMRHDKDPERPLADLTTRQIDVLRLIAMGKTNSQIAAIRGISLKAVESMVARVFQSLGIDEKSDGNSRVILAQQFVRSAGQPLTLDPEPQ